MIARSPDAFVGACSRGLRREARLTPGYERTAFQAEKKCGPTPWDSLICGIRTTKGPAKGVKSDFFFQKFFP